MFNKLLFLASDCCEQIGDGWFSQWFYDKTFIEIGNFSVAKYAICLLTSIVIAFFVCTKEGEKMGIERDKVLTILIITVPICVIFGRIGYMLTDGVPTFANKIEQYGVFKGILGGLLSIIGFENAPASFTFYGISGMTMIGVIIGAFTMIVISCIWHKWNLLNFMDEVTPGLLIGSIVGRWGNFFNQEAYGIVVGGWSLDGNTLVPNLTLAEQYQKLLSFGIPKFIANNMCIYGGNYYYGLVDGAQLYGSISGYAYFHPAFLYESLLNLIGLIVYFIVRRYVKKLRSGQIACGYLMWYGVVRFFVEFIRTDSLYINFFGTPVKNAQVFCVIFFLIGLGLLLYLAFFKKNPELYQDAIKKGEKLREANAQEAENEEVVKLGDK
ncbi:MAG: prolipoprotein diacylglyceryl transferase [Gammaproteobacteria bacterium]|nr:prolipoprotein diacylglyceryl transferase [Gammaproteobacteria bacterium]